MILSSPQDMGHFFEEHRLAWIEFGGHQSPRHRARAVQHFPAVDEKRPRQLFHVLKDSHLTGVEMTKAAVMEPSMRGERNVARLSTGAPRPLSSA